MRPEPSLSWPRILTWLCLFGALWSLQQNAELISSTREFAYTGEIRKVLRFILSLLPLFAIPLALLKESLRKPLLWLTFGLGMAILVDTTFGGRDPDEGVHLHLSWMMAEGWVPYRDFFTVRNLLWHAMCIPLVVLMENSMEIIHIARTLMLFCSAAFLGILVFVGRRCKSHFVAPMLALAVPFFPWGAVEFRADPPMTLCLIAALWALSRGYPGLAGILSGLGFLMLQKAAFHGIAMGAGILLSGMGWRWVASYSLGAISVSVLHMVWALLLGIWTEYYNCTFVCSSAFASYHQQTPFLESMSLVVFGQELQYYPLLCLLSLVGCILWWRSDDKFCRLLAVCLIVDMGFVFLGKIAFKNYLLFPVALMGLACGRAFKEMEDKEVGELESAIPTTCILILLGIGALRHSAVPPRSIEIAEASEVIRLLPQNETYYGDGLRANLINPIFRTNATYYPHDATRMVNWFSKSGSNVVTPNYTPGQNVVLAQKLPGAFSMGRKRAESFLELVKKQSGTQYKEVFQDLYLREDLLETLKN